MSTITSTSIANNPSTSTAASATSVASSTNVASTTNTGSDMGASSAGTVLLTMLLHVVAWLRRTWQTARRRVGNDRAMSTIEYALGCVAAAGLGALLYTVVTGDDVAGALSDIFTRALETK